jgi:phosphate transport system permease protein
MLPAAAPGVFAAVLLGIGRAFGETMIAIMATGNAPLTSLSPFEPARTVAATIGSEMGEVVWGSEHYGVLFFMGVMLFVFSFGLNAVTELYVKKRLIKKFQGR